MLYNTIILKKNKCRNNEYQTIKVSHLWELCAPVLELLACY